MKTSIYLFCFLCLGAFASKAQTYEDVVYLKNGSIIHGIIIEQVPNQSLKIQTRDGNVFVFTISEVEKITKENKIDNQPKFKRKSPGAAFALSFLAMPGVGQLYNGQKGKGIPTLIFSIGSIVGMGVGLSLEDENGNWTDDGVEIFAWSFLAQAVLRVASGIDAPISAAMINRRNKTLGFNYKINDKLNMSLKPDYRLGLVQNKITPVFGAKLSLNLN